MRKTRIAYLAPEIPALSATFVYNEILCLESIGFEVVPISVHIPGSVAEEDSIAELKSRTIYLYTLSKCSLIRTNLKELIRNPVRYFTVLAMAVRDAFKIGFTSHTGMGLLFRFMMSSRVVNILRDNGCRHLHTHFAHIPTDIAMYASGISGIPFSFTSHANDLFERGWLLREKVERSGFAVIISEFNREFLLKIGAADILADKARMTQVLKNLIGNAVKFSPAGCTVRIDAKVVDGNYQVSIQDEGIGMTTEETEKMFDRFYRADSSSTAKEGTGLGMSIVKHIVEAHDGKIWVESEAGKGMTVTFSIPMS